MSQYIPNFYWTFNCSPGPNDYDYNAHWGEITIQRTNLQYIKVTLHHWNEIDGWKTTTRTFIPPNAPTSDPYSFNPSLGSGFCKSPDCNHENYFNKKYKFNTVFEIIYGGNGQQITIDEYFYDSNQISDNLKYCSNDLLYKDLHNCFSNLPSCN
jgi:hypothetical protein